MKILIIKLGAMGDVLRTTPLLKAYKSRDPGCHITWVVEERNRPILESNPFIDELITWNSSTPEKLSKRSFDLTINLDKEKEALNTVQKANSREKRGFGWNHDQTDIIALNPASEYAVRLGKDDRLKFRENQKTYQEISFEQAELPFANEDYIFHISDENRSFAWNHFKRFAGRSVIGISTGSGPRFAGKSLSEEHIIELCRQFGAIKGYHVLLLGGPDEKEKNMRLESLTTPYASNAGQHSIGRFAALVQRLSAVVTGDTIAMHIAIAMKVPVVAFFGSTCASEIHLYGNGSKIVSELDCAPCYKKDCPIDEKCMKETSVSEIVQEVDRLLSSGIKVS